MSGFSRTGTYVGAGFSRPDARIESHVAFGFSRTVVGADLQVRLFLFRRCEAEMLDRILDGRTDLVFDYVSQGHPAKSNDGNGVPLIKWCAYYGDVSAIRFLLANGESLGSLGENLDLNGAVFHGHWRLSQFLIEHGADVNRPAADTGEAPLHAALCTAHRPSTNLMITFPFVLKDDRWMSI